MLYTIKLNAANITGDGTAVAIGSGAAAKTERPDLSQSGSLEDFKQDFFQSIQSFAADTVQTKGVLSIHISDAAFSQMYENPDYANKILDQIERDLAYVNAQGLKSLSSSLSLDDTGRYEFDVAPIPAADPQDSLLKNCYWDKRSMKIKAEIERSVEKSAEERRIEAQNAAQKMLDRETVESSNRRSSLEGKLYVL